MKTKLAFEDFEMQPLGYMSYRGKKCEICLEPCLNGCDVAVYDLSQDLLEPKVCTDIDFAKTGDILAVFAVRSLALRNANIFYQKYEKNKQ